MCDIWLRTVQFGVRSLFFPVSLSFLGFIIKHLTHQRLTMEILTATPTSQLIWISKIFIHEYSGSFHNVTKKAPTVKPLSLHVPYLISSVSAAADVKLYVSVNLNTADLDMIIVKSFDSVIMSLKIFWQIVRKKKKKMLASPQPTHSFSLKCNNCTTIELFHPFQNNATRCFSNNHHFTLLSVLSFLFFPLP